ncbi:sigma-70 family RNA polymerase sigma factor [Streptomyces sp. TRM66268-LWL]|uniref:RNA polymerase sigma factor n=1 Tax=Streptomyces polyasparticus TaxID=2767826 RepID=A0ABR7SKJ6_9ACTN|nr:sigma-70 family RNA polymerase sigma factor [Streptomyces polyasparticus]MBC9715995.1 sigma-70 family RNA polymerase sigma factor [Streptomyces polyasparticus]
MSRESGALVRAAQNGDRRAQADLVTAYLPLVYNVVGRALDGHADVDDVVQDTMLRALRGIDGLQDPLRFRSWLVAIAVNQVRRHWQARQSAPDAFGLRDAYELADPAGDFVNVTIVRLGLEGQRREVAEATRWLESDDRELLSLWWLEAAGELTRPELAAALEISEQHAAVRVQRMKGQLETARVVVRALAAPPCPGLGAVVGIWDGIPSGLWRKRIARHVRECQLCSRHAADLWPAEGLLVGFGLVPVAAAAGAGLFAALGLYGEPAAQTVAFADPAGASWDATADEPWDAGGSDLTPAGPTRLEERRMRVRKRRRTATAAAAVVLLVTGVTAVGIDLMSPDSDSDKVQAATATASDSPSEAESTAAETQSPSPSVSKSPSPSASKKPSRTAKPTPTTPKPQPTKTRTTEPAPAPKPPANPGGTHAQQVLALVNAERAKAGCSPVTMDSRLSKAAQLHSEDMSANNYFSHTSQDGRTFVDRAKAQGVDNPGAENIARGQSSARSVMDAWMNSEGHRANILNCGLKTMGLGVVTSDWTWTQMFGW